MKVKALVCLSLIALVASRATAARAQSFDAIYAFSGPSGVIPSAGVTIKAGVLYGTTLCQSYPGNCGAGAVYEISHVGSGWTHTAISLLSSASSLPQARVVFGPDGLLYGTAGEGGPQDDGAVFTLTPVATICKTANCFWHENVLHQFTGSPDGEGPGLGDLIWDSTGNIYGTTNAGGSSDLGTVFEMTKVGNNWTETPIYSFTGPDGEDPAGGLVLDSNGNLFGTTAGGGQYGYGTVFELTYNVTGWTETVLYSFQNQSDGRLPYAGLVRDSSGNFYGATTYGGAGVGGTVFELSPAGNSWIFGLLYSFTGQQEQQCGPWAALTIDDSGNLYGTTFCSGANNLGNVFKLTNTQNGWQYSSLHDFAGGSDGAEPVSNVTIDTDGTLYGTAGVGGNNTCNAPLGCGTVWMIKP